MLFRFRIKVMQALFLFFYLSQKRCCAIAVINCFGHKENLLFIKDMIQLSNKCYATFNNFGSNNLPIYHIIQNWAFQKVIFWSSWFNHKSMQEPWKKYVVWKNKAAEIRNKFTLTKSNTISILNRHIRLSKANKNPSTSGLTHKLYA